MAVAGNYAAHRHDYVPVPETRRALPEAFSKPATTVIGPDELILLPGALCSNVDYEGELAVVIGRTGHEVPVRRALDYVAGYVNFNDVSGSRLDPGVDRANGPRTALFDWLAGRWFDTFGPCGPWLIATDEVPDPQALSLETRVNGEVRQQASISQMLHSVAGIVAWISRLLTLEPGDLIATGTPEGVGSAAGRYLRPGDVVEVTIGSLGRLRDPVVAPPTAARV